MYIYIYIYTCIYIYVYIYIYICISGWWFSITILKNDGIRQWEGLINPYMKWKIKTCFKPPTSIYIYIHTYMVAESQLG